MSNDLSYFKDLRTSPRSSSKQRKFIMKYLIVLLLLSSCSKKGQQVSVTNTIDQYNVQLLFKIDNCSVYRFIDGRDIYFTSCEGNTQYDRNCGKNCTEKVQMSTK